MGSTIHLDPDFRDYARPDGVISDVTPMSFASITDGLSQTFLVGERATAKLLEVAAINPQIATSCGCYFRGALGDTLFTTFHPPNVPRKVAIAAGLSHGFAASSLYAGLVNMLM